MSPLRVAVCPVESWLPRHVAVEAVESAGGRVEDPSDAQALVWLHHNADGLGTLLAQHPSIQWVQLPWAGVEPYLEVMGGGHVWTSAKGVYAEPVAELALTLLLGGLRGLDTYVPARRWSSPRGVNLLGARIVIVGGGGIARSLLRLLEPFGADVTVVRRDPEPLRGAGRVLPVVSLDQALEGAEGVVLALALTVTTQRILNLNRLRLLAPHGWLVNVARGRHVVTDDLVRVLTDGAIGGAALDVTDPEPLPDDHPLWTLPNCIITPHVGSTPEMTCPLLATRISENVRRRGAGEPLLGLIDAGFGY